MEQHPEQAVGFEFVGEGGRGLEELVVVIDPCMPDQKANRKNHSRLPEVSIGDVNTSTISPCIY